MNLKLTQLDIQGFKSFGREQNIRFGDITIFIGANGSGKSNLMSFFEMLSWMMDKKLEQYVAVNGGVSFFTHLGILKSLIEAKVFFQSTSTMYSYEFSLSPSSGRELLLYSEKIFERQVIDEPAHQPYYHASGIQKESGLENIVRSTNKDEVIGGLVWSFLKNTLIYRLDETSSNSAIRSDGYVNNTGYLMSNGGNLAAFLYGLQQSSFNKYYDRIVKNIKLAYPSFDDFVLTPTPFSPDNVRLDWRDKDCPPNFRFSPQQLSDGTLRFMALTALLLQPPETIPKLIVIDEPELGLHPSALSLLSNMIYTASKYSQIVLATQSAELLDYFEPEHIRVVEREGSNSIIKEPDSESLKYWLEEYSLGQIWEKNIIGGRP